MKNKFWNLDINSRTGAIARLNHPRDPHGMNWVSNSAENAWFLDSHGWGLGFLTMSYSAAQQRWQQPIALSTTRARYRMEAVDVTVTRRLQGAQLTETIEFRNHTKIERTIGTIGLYAPFNDNYPNAATCVTNRCNAHLWCGGNVAYACCLRMGNTAPHLGLVMTEGFIGGYSIENRGLRYGSSNVRGSIVFNAKGATLQPRTTHRISWTFFWHTGWDDFFAQARQIPGFVDVRADHYTVVGRQEPKIMVSVQGAKIEKPADDTIKVRYGQNRETWLRINRVANVKQLVRRRVAFIRDRQQIKDRRHPLHGAILPYDNALEATFRNPDWSDQKEGRERLGMGVLLALSLQRWRDPKTTAAVKLYHRFVRTKLQQADGTVLNAVGDADQRLYNYPWVAQFHLEMFRAFGQRRYLTDCFKTLRTYYRRGGEKFYAIGIPIFEAVRTFHAAGLKREAAMLQRDFLRHGDKIVATGLNFPAHEVNYEQSIVGPAVNMALECYLLSRDERYLAGARQLLPALEAFNGRQPDHHLHEIGIRHWDGFWFGRKQIWGDTFPHYWSALTGWAFYRYWQATGDESYRQRASGILLGNLSAFTTDGRAHCAYIYPDTVNGNPARCWDSLANDQDWALVMLLQVARDIPSLLSTG